MAKTIGNLAAQLSLNAAPFVQGLATASKVAGKGAAAIGGALASTMWSAGKVAGKRLADGLAAGYTAGKRLTLAAPALGAGLLTAAAVSGYRRLVEDDVAARTLGVSIDELRTATLALGPAGEQGLGLLAEKLAAVRTGSYEAALDFRRLGAIAGEPLDVGNLTTLDALAQTAQRIASIQDPLARAAQGVTFFGDKWALLAPDLMRGAEGFDRAKRALGNFGLGVNPAELESIRQVARTVRELQALWQGFANQTILALSPIAAELSKMFDVTKLDISGFKQGVFNTLETLARIGAGVIDVLSDTGRIRAAWEVLAQYMRGALLDVLASFQRALGNTLEGLPGMGERADVMREMAVGNSYEARSARSLAGTLARGLNEDLASTPLRKAVDGLFDRARATLNAPSRTGPGVEGPVLEARRIVEQFGQTMGSIQQPLLTFRTQLTQINQFERFGMFAGNQQARGLMGFQAFQGLQQSVGFDTKFAGASEKGSREAYSTIIRHQQNLERQPVQEQIRALLQVGKEQQEKQIQIGLEVLQAIRDIGLPDPGPLR